MRPGKVRIAQQLVNAEGMPASHNGLMLSLNSASPRTPVRTKRRKPSPSSAGWRLFAFRQPTQQTDFHAIGLGINVLHSNISAERNKGLFRVGVFKTKARSFV